jgi:beta-phosphoglucomutase-like phosphatase (HAD superfamily)
MALQAVLLGMSGVLINDEDIHLDILNRLLLEDNLRPLSKIKPEEYRLLYLGRPEAERIRLIWGDQGRVLNPAQLWQIIARKHHYYLQVLQQKETIPLLPNVKEALESMGDQGMIRGLVTGYLPEDVTYILTQTHLASLFILKITGESLVNQPESMSVLYKKGLDSLHLLPQQCLAIEASYVGLASAQAAGIPTLAVSTFFPMHMLQRRAQWVVDRLDQIEWDRLKTWYSKIEKILDS